MTARHWLSALYWSWCIASALLIAAVLVGEGRRAWAVGRDWWRAKRSMKHFETFRTSLRRMQ